MVLTVTRRFQGVITARIRRLRGIVWPVRLSVLLLPTSRVRPRRSICFLATQPLDYCSDVMASDAKRLRFWSRLRRAPTAVQAHSRGLVGCPDSA